MKILAQAKTEKMKKEYDAYIKQIGESGKLFIDTGSGKVFVNRNGVISSIEEQETVIGGIPQITLQEVPVSRTESGGNAYLNAINQ